MLEVRLRSPDDFLKVAETLTRMGIPSLSAEKKVLYQSCHILHRKSRYYIVGFKELFSLDGRETDITQEDISRRNTIAVLLDEWKLLEIVGGRDSLAGISKSKIKVIRHSERSEWELRPKYKIGMKK